MSILKSSAKASKKAITIRIDTELFDKLEKLRKLAAAKKMKLNISEPLGEHLEKLIDRTIKELQDE